MSTDRRDDIVVGAHSGATAYVVGWDGPGPWTNLGQGKVGAHGVPSLVGTGDLAGGDDYELTLTHARSFASSFLVIGASRIDAPFKGGVLVPAPTIVAGPIPVSEPGGWSLDATWPPGVPSGVSLFWQVWVADTMAVFNFAGTNGVQSTTP